MQLISFRLGDPEPGYGSTTTAAPSPMPRLPFPRQSAHTPGHKAASSRPVDSGGVHLHQQDVCLARPAGALSVPRGGVPEDRGAHRTGQRGAQDAAAIHGSCWGLPNHLNFTENCNVMYGTRA